MAAAPIYGSVEADDAVRATMMVLSSKRRRQQLAAGAIALVGLFAVNSARNAKLPTRAMALTATEAATSCPAVFGYDVVAYHLGMVRPSQAGLPGSSEYSASLSTSYGSYVFWFRNSHNRDLFIEDPWAYAPRMGTPSPPRGTPHRSGTPHLTASPPPSDTPTRVPVCLSRSPSAQK